SWTPMASCATSTWANCRVPPWPTGCGGSRRNRSRHASAMSVSRGGTLLGRGRRCGLWLARLVGLELIYRVLGNLLELWSENGHLGLHGLHELRRQRRHLRDHRLTCRRSVKSQD